jgi:hypothetical protein
MLHLAAERVQSRNWHLHCQVILACSACFQDHANGRHASPLFTFEPDFCTETYTYAIVTINPSIASYFKNKQVKGNIYTRGIRPCSPNLFFTGRLLESVWRASTSQLLLMLMTICCFCPTPWAVVLPAGTAGPSVPVAEAGAGAACPCSARGAT